MNLHAQLSKALDSARKAGRVLSVEMGPDVFLRFEKELRFGTSGPVNPEAHRTFEDVPVKLVMEKGILELVLEQRRKVKT